MFELEAFNIESKILNQKPRTQANILDAIGDAVGSVFGAFDTERDVSQSTQLDPATQERQNFLFGKVKDYMNTSYNQYGGDRYAGFTPDQLRSFEMARNMEGTGQGQYQNIYDTAQGVSQYRPDQLQASSILGGRPLDDYMSPYTNQVINPVMQQMRDDLQLQLNKLDEGTTDSFNNRTGFEATRLKSQALSDMANTRARMMGEAYDRAMALKAGDMARAEGADRFNIGTGMQGQRLNLGALNPMMSATGAGRQAGFQDMQAYRDIGNLQQRLNQLDLDFDYQQDREAMYYPERQLQMAGNLINSMSSGQTTTGTQYGNTLSENLGSGAMVAKAFMMCIPDGTFIDTEDDPVEIGDVEVGDTIIGFTGEPVAVLQKHEYLENPDEERFYQITFDDGTSVDCCDMHRINGIRAMDYKIGDDVDGNEITGIITYGKVTKSYDLLTEDGGYQIGNIPVNSMISELAELVTEMSKTMRSENDSTTE